LGASFRRKTTKKKAMTKGNVAFCAVLQIFMQFDRKEPNKTGETNKNESRAFL